MEEALRGLLAGNAGVSALVGQNIHWRLAPQAAPTGSWIVMHRISGVRQYHTLGPAGLVESRVQVDCIGGRYSDAKAIARAVVAATSGYRGTTGGMAIQGIFIDGERDDHDETTGETAVRFRTSLDLTIWHPEP